MTSDDFSDDPIDDVVPEYSPDEVQSADAEIEPTFDLSIFVETQGILCKFHCAGRNVEWTVPKTVVRRAHKAIAIDHLFDILGAGPIIGYQLREAVTNNPEFLMVPRAVNTLTDRITKALRQVQKALALPVLGAERE